MITIPEPTLKVPEHMSVPFATNGDEWLLLFLRPAKPWGSNARLHHMARNNLVRQWRSAAAEAASLAVEPKDGFWYVRVSIPFLRGGRRDPHNFTGTVAKSVVDGLVEAGVWPDDVAEYVHVGDPICRVVRKPAEPLVGVHAWRAEGASSTRAGGK